MSENGQNNEKINEEKTIDEEKTPETESQEESKPEKKKYIFNCTKCGQCCEKKEYVPVSFVDIRNWTKSGAINSIFPNLKIMTQQVTVGEQTQEFPSLVIKGSEEGCSMFDKENRLCNIYHLMPLECKAFPLGYNGKNYYIKDKTVPGLGSGKMSKEQLIQDRDNARADFEAKIETQITLPLIYSLFMQNLLEQQQKAMDEMPEEKRKQLDELLRSTKNPSN
jgi:Fe-S-cluster containining protein